ncbi:MAG: hypothetical protein Q7S74_01375 [Nanoarchaeota archaeon]|nr:hypothetical protein [Nanoarchaeota archaeon]
MIYKKKGLSEVVATILIVLLTVSAVVIIMGVIVPFVKKSLSESTRCVDYKDYFDFYEKMNYNCKRSFGSSSLYAFSVGAQNKIEETATKVIGFDLVFVGEGATKSVEAMNGSQAVRTDEGLRMLNYTVSNIETPGRGEVRTYVYNSSQNYKEVQVYPVLTNGICTDMSDSIKIDSICESGLDLSIK